AGVGGEPNIIGSDEDDTEAHMRNFFDCVRSRKEPNCSFELGFRSAIACQMAIASLRQGRTVEWDPEKEDIGWSVGGTAIACWSLCGLFLAFLAMLSLA